MIGVFICKVVVSHGLHVVPYCQVPAEAPDL